MADFIQRFLSRRKILPGEFDKVQKEQSQEIEIIQDIIKEVSRDIQRDLKKSIEDEMKLLEQTIRRTIFNEMQAMHQQNIATLQNTIFDKLGDVIGGTFGNEAGEILAGPDARNIFTQILGGIFGTRKTIRTTTTRNFRLSQGQSSSQLMQFFRQSTRNI